MALLTITNVSGAIVPLPDIVVDLGVGQTVTVEYQTDHFPRFPDVIAARNAGLIEVTIDYGITEKGAEAEGDSGPAATLWNFSTVPYSFHVAGVQPDRFYESNEDEVFALAEAQGVTVYKLSDYGVDPQAAINAAQGAGAGNIVWFDAAYDVEVAATINIADSVPVQIFGFSRDPSQTVLKRAVGGVFPAILKLLAGQTLSDAMDSPEMALPRNRILIRDITLDGQNGAAGLFGFHCINTGTTAIKHVTLENVVSKNCKTYGFNLEGLSSDPDPMEDFIYDGCEAYGNAGTGIKHDSGALTCLKIRDCKFYDNAMTGIYLRNTDLSWLEITRCVFGYNGEYGALIEDTDDALARSLIQDSVFHQNGWKIAASNPAGLIFYNESSSDGHMGVTVRRCKFYQNGAFVPFTNANGDDHGSGIKVKLKGTATNLVIEDCGFDGNGQFGISLHARGGSYASTSRFTGITVRRCNFGPHPVAALGADSLGLDSDVTAIGNYWGSSDGAADAPTDTSYTPDMYIGAGHGGSPPAGACLSFTPMGYKKVTNVGETAATVTVTVTN